MINRLFSIPLPPLQSSPSGGIGRRDGLKIHCPQQTCRFEPGPGHGKRQRRAVFFHLPDFPPYSRTILAKVCSFRLRTTSFARDSGNSARDSAPRPFIRARFRRKCAHSGSAPLHSRAILAIVCVQRPLRGDSGVFWAETLPKQTFVGNQDADFRYI